MTHSPLHQGTPGQIIYVLWLCRSYYQSTVTLNLVGLRAEFLPELNAKEL